MKSSAGILCCLILTASIPLAAENQPQVVSPADVMKLLSKERAAPARVADEPVHPAAAENDVKPPAEPARAESTNDTAVAYTGPRDPFWPVGYTPRPKEDLEKKEIKVTPQYKEEWPDLGLRGIIRQGKHKYMAVLDRVGIVETGEVVSLEKGNLVYQWRIEDITRTDVSYSRIEARPKRNLAEKEDAQ